MYKTLILSLILVSLIDPKDVKPPTNGISQIEKKEIKESDI